MLNIHNLQKLLDRQLTRKEFIQVIGLMVLSVIGVSGMLSRIDKTLNSNSVENKGKNPSDYGEYNYGG